MDWMKTGWTKRPRMKTGWTKTEPTVLVPSPQLRISWVINIKCNIYLFSSEIIVSSKQNEYLKCDVYFNLTLVNNHIFT